MALMSLMMSLASDSRAPPCRRRARSVAARAGRIVLGVEVEPDHVERVEQLALVLVQPLDLDVEQRVGIEAMPVAADVLRPESTLFARLTAAMRAHEAGVAG